MKRKTTSKRRTMKGKLRTTWRMKAPGDLGMETNNEGTFYYKENEKGELEYHRSNGPAIVRNPDNGANRYRAREEWWVDGKLHRLNGPALISADGTENWYLNGKRHREGGPAIENEKIKEWWMFGKRHRLDGPATVIPGDEKMWWVDGKLHREDGPAIEKEDGTKYWYINGEHHREDGPAIEYANGTKYWFRNGVLHRLDGPAVDIENGLKEWYINGKRYSEENFERERQRIYKNLLLTNYAMVKTGITNTEPIKRIQYYSTR